MSIRPSTAAIASTQMLHLQLDIIQLHAFIKCSRRAERIWGVALQLLLIKQGSCRPQLTTLVPSLMLKRQLFAGELHLQLWADHCYAWGW